MGVNKLHLPWGTGTLLSNIIDLMQSSFSDVVIVGDNPVRESIANLKVQFIADEVRSGPLNGILIGLRAIKHRRALVVAADLPLITLNAINHLLQIPTDADVTVVRTDDGDHPLFGIYHKNCISPISISLEAGFRKVTRFWKDVNIRIIDVGNDPYWKRNLFNINCPQDYQIAQSLIQNELLPARKASGHVKY